MTLRGVVVFPALGALLVACGARSIPSGPEGSDEPSTIPRDAGTGAGTGAGTSKPITTTTVPTAGPSTRPPEASETIPPPFTGIDVTGVAPVTGPTGPTSPPDDPPLVPPPCTDADAAPQRMSLRGNTPSPPLQRIVLREVCGDGRLTGRESCDDANLTPGDGCGETCQVEPYYECPQPGNECVFVGVCGDGVVAGPEQCDPGSRPGCNEQCQLATGWVCPSGQPCLTVCGDGIKAGVESCDDGNNVNDDGCDASCRVEWNYCRTHGCESSNDGVCGDGVVDPGEACDDSGASAACSDSCQWLPQCNSEVCAPTCGDGLVIDEECDDGNVTDGDGCSTTCTVEPGFTCTRVALSDSPEFDSFPPDLDVGTSSCEPLCGDAIHAPGEQCDLGQRNGAGDAYCRVDCTLGPYCGDGVVDEGETCDDGHNVAGLGDPGGCAPGCVAPGYCGDGIVQAGEECDDGRADNNGAYGGCTSHCTLAARCGDGVVQACGNEECDEGPGNQPGCIMCTKR